MLTYHVYALNPHVTPSYTHNTCTLTQTHTAHVAHVDYKFPMENETGGSTRWKKIKQYNKLLKLNMFRLDWELF